MLARDQVRAPGVWPADVVEDALKYLQKERASPTGKIEHCNSPMVGEAVYNPEAVFQNVVHRAHDEIHNRWRRVIDTPPLAHPRVISLQVILVEVDERIALK